MKDWALVLAMLVSGACKPLKDCRESKEVQKAREAYTEVIDYSTEYKQRHTVWRAKKLPGYVWAVRENRDDPQRPSLDLDIAVPAGASEAQITKRLQVAARAGKGAAAVKVVRVQAWLHGLVAFGGVVGTAYLAADGRGWDGRGNTFRGVRVNLGRREGAHRPSALDAEVLRALEQRRRMLLADPQRTGRKNIWLRKPALLERETVLMVAPQLGLTADSVTEMVRNARRYWWKPRWQPLPITKGQ